MTHRTQITLTDEQYQRLLDESQRSGLALAALVRRAVERSYGSTPADEALAALDTSFGSWSDRPDNGERSVEGLRRGTAHRLAG